MGRSIPLTIGAEYFSKKMDVEKRIHSMVSRYSPMANLSESDTTFCLELFKHHPRSAQKIGVGISRIQVRLDQYGHKCFHLHRFDGSDDDISWTKCLKAAK
jgi:hypothetical protein